MGTWPALQGTLAQAAKAAAAKVGNVFRGDVRSANWDGGGDLSGGKDATATLGYLIDYGSGAAQFQAIYAEGGELGTLTVTSDVTLGTGGVFRTATSGARVYLASATQASIFLFSGAAGESQQGTIYTSVTGSGATEVAAVLINSPAMDGATWGDMLIQLRSASEDDSTSRPQIIFSSPGDSAQIPWLDLRDFEVDTSGGSLRLPLKGDTGDPSTPSEGQMYVNTSDNKVRVYADAAWRDLATW